MSAHIDFKKTSELKPTVKQAMACEKCAGMTFRDVSRIAGDSGMKDSVIYECVDCGEYRL